MAHAEGMHRETRREQDAHPRPGACATPAPHPPPPAIHPQQPEPRHRRRPACQGRLHDSCTTTGKASTMKVQEKCSRSAATAFSPAPARPSAPPGSACRRGHERPACAAPAPDLRPGPLPAPSPRPSGPPGCCRCAGPAAGSRPLAARRRASRPARGPARHAAGPADRCARPVAAPLHAHSGFHAQDHHVEHEGQAALDVARKAGCPPARPPHPSHRNASHVSQPAQPAATAVATSGGMSASEHGAAPHASILAMRRISTTPAVSSAASSASTPQPAGVRHSRFMIAGSSR